MTSTMKEELSKCIFTLTGIFWFCYKIYFYLMFIRSTLKEFYVYKAITIDIK